MITSHAKENYIAGGALDGTIKIWDLAQDGKAVRTFGCSEGTSCIGLKFHPFVDILATMSSNSIIHLWDFRQRRIIKQIDAPEDVNLQSTGLPCLEFSPDGKWFCYSTISNSENILNIWELSSGRKIQSLVHPLNEGIVTELIFHPQQMIICTITESGTLRIWDMGTFSEISTIIPFNESNETKRKIKIMFNNDGNSLFLFMNHFIEIYSWNDSKLELIGKDTVSWKQTPSHILRSNSSFLVLSCETSSSFGLWLMNGKYEIKNSTSTLPLPIDMSNEKQDTKPLQDQTNIPMDNIPSKSPLIKKIKEKPIQPSNVRITSDRKNSEYSLDLEQFCTSILENDNNTVNESDILSNLTGNNHKSFCATMMRRKKQLTTLSETKKEDIQSILNLFTQSKNNNIDLGMLHISIRNCISLIDQSNLQLEQLSMFNSLLPKLMNSNNNIFILCAIECLHSLVIKYGSMLRESRPNKLLVSLQTAKKIGQDTTRPMLLQKNARAACKAYVDQSNS